MSPKKKAEYEAQGITPRSTIQPNKSKRGATRKAVINRTSAPKRSGPVKAKKRSASEFARIYGSKERVAWVKALHCFACECVSPFIGQVTAGRCHNAHTETGGMGRKADANTIIPLCASHHRRYDEHKKPFETDAARDAAKKYARAVDAEWQRIACA